jgi:leader peptidase (prepilin peptidase)/N-methyltransferase
LRFETFAWLACAVAPFVGSFLGVVIERMPAGRSILHPRSSCDHCGHRLGFRDLIPVVSWLISAGRCRYCGRMLGGFYPAIELAATAIVASALLALPDGPIPTVSVSIALGWTLLTVAWIDARWLILPDSLTLPLIAAGLLAAWATGQPVLEHMLGAAIGFVGLASVAAAYHRWRGREGLGLGDAKLMAAAGSWLGWEALPDVLLIGAVAGLMLGSWLGRRGDVDMMRLRVPFGPPLALAFWSIWLLGPIVPYG